MTTLSTLEYRQLIESAYTDSEGLVSKDKHPGRWSSGNGALITAVHFVLCKLLDVARIGDVTSISHIVCMLWSGPVDALTLGLLERNDGRPDQDAWDNYVAVCAMASMYFLVHIPQAICDYGSRHFWFMQNEPGFKNWLRSAIWRFPGIVPFIHICARENINPLDRFILGRRIEDASDGPGADITKWLMAVAVLAAVPAGWASLRTSARQKLLRLNLLYGSIPAMLGQYYGPSHPFARLSPFTYPEWLDSELFVSQGELHGT